MMTNNPQLIYGSEHVDERGSLFFFNSFNLEPARRFYVIHQHETGIVRAWQGHKRERKWFYVVRGAFKIVLIKPDDWEKPSADLAFEEFIIHESDIQVLHIPAGFASGFVAIEPNSKLMIFSNFSLEESVQDDFRFDKGMWYKW
jgi:dTDP-4-dehydrorhamnose 3,5-epimerase-like enzyme